MVYDVLGGRRRADADGAARWRGDAGSLRTVTYDLASVPCPMLRDEGVEADEGRGNETRAGRDLDQD